VTCAPANVHDVMVAHKLLHGEEADVYAEAGYQGIEKRGETGAVKWHVAMRPSKRRKLDTSEPLDAIYEKIERLKTGVRAKVEHPFSVLKCQFGYLKARYRGLVKITTQSALVNLWMAGKVL
jgi:IS5 family transposase